MKRLITLVVAILFSLPIFAHAAGIADGTAKRFVAQALKARGITGQRVKIIRDGNRVAARFFAMPKNVPPNARIRGYAGAINLSKAKDAPKGVARVTVEN